MKVQNGVLKEVLAVSLLPLQFGWHMSELNALIPVIGCRGVESPSYRCIPGFGSGALPVSIYAIGGVIGSAIAGPLADSQGRKPTFIVIALLFLLCSPIIALASSVSLMSLGRVGAGIAAGGSIVIAPMVVHEVSSPDLASTLSSSVQISINVGILLTQSVGAILGTHKLWPWALHCGTLIAVIAVIVQSKYTVESPAWLRRHGKPSESEERWLEIEPHIDEPEPHQSILSFVKNHLRVALGVIAIMVLQQLTGINSIILYGVPILQKTMGGSAAGINIVLSAINLLVTGGSAALIGRWGSRHLLLYSLLGMGVSIACLAFSLIRDLSGLAFFSAVLTIVAFAIGVGPIPFGLVGAVAPSDALGAAQSVATVANWLATFAIGAFFPSIHTWLGDSVFYIFSCCCFAGAVAIWKLLPQSIA